MKILLLTQVLPYPPDSGPKVKTWNVLKYLAQRHEVTLVSFVRGDQSAEAKQLQRYCSAIYTVPMVRGALRDGLAMGRSLLNGQPWMMVRDDRAAMGRLVDRLASETPFDIAHADQLNMAQYSARVTGARKVLDAHNALWLLYKRLWETMEPGPKKLMLGRDWRLLKEYEGRVCREFDAVLAVSQEDKAALQEAAGQPLGVTIIPITVDTDEVIPVTRQPGANHILHIGTMYWPPNIDGVLWFVHQVYPLIRAKRPHTIFDLVGARPPREILDLGGDGTGINVTGYVKDPTPYLEQAGVMVVPLRAGGGMRVKILNALAQSVPIVTTGLGCEGIAVTPGQDILVADNPEEFAEAVLRVLDSPEFAAQLANNGRRLAEQQYDYRQACLPIDAVYNRVMRRAL
jgi:glycosyltransferase involved in cell wall biosynthesis